MAMVLAWPERQNHHPTEQSKAKHMTCVLFLFFFALSSPPSCHTFRAERTHFRVNCMENKHIYGKHSSDGSNEPCIIFIVEKISTRARAELKVRTNRWKREHQIERFSQNWKENFQFSRENRAKIERSRFFARFLYLTCDSLYSEEKKCNITIWERCWAVCEHKSSAKIECTRSSSQLPKESGVKITSYFSD